MINSILEHYKKKIVIDRLFVKENGTNRIVLDSSEIKTKINYHFQNTAVPNIPFSPLSSRWIEQYKPISSIDDTWYNNILQPSEWNEWISIIKALPNDKTAGPSEIYNEYLKYLDP